MADNERYADDIAELWGPREETAVEPLLPDPHPRHSSGIGSTNANGNGNGAHGFGREQPEDVARLAEAIAGRRLPGATRDDLEAMRSELEATFTQQLAVAIYELMTSSNERLATFEDHVNSRLDGVGAAVDEEVGRLAGSVNSHRRALAEEFEAVRSQLGAVRGDLTRLAEERELEALWERVTVLEAEIAGLRRPLPRRPGQVRRRRGWNSAP